MRILWIWCTYAVIDEMKDLFRNICMRLFRKNERYKHDMKLQMKWFRSFLWKEMKSLLPLTKRLIEWLRSSSYGGVSVGKEKENENPASL